MGLFSKKKAEPDFKKTSIAVMDPQDPDFQQAQQQVPMAVPSEVVQQEAVQQAPYPEQQMTAPPPVAPRERTQVVKEYPMVPAKKFVDDQGIIVNLITIEDFLTEQANV